MQKEQSGKHFGMAIFEAVPDVTNFNDAPSFQIIVVWISRAEQYPPFIKLAFTVGLCTMLTWKNYKINCATNIAWFDFTAGDKSLLGKKL